MGGMVHAHLVLWGAGLVALFVAAYFARGHELHRHHISALAGVGFFTLSAVLTLFDDGVAGSLVSARLGSYVLVLGAVMSGFLYLGGRLSRGTHRSVAIFALALAALTILLTAGVL